MKDFFASFLQGLAEAAKRYHPLAEDTLRTFLEATEAAAEKKPTGGATTRARQAIQALRNPFLKTTHHGKAKAVAAILVKQTGKDFGGAFAAAMESFALHQQAILEHDLIQGNSEVKPRQKGAPGDSVDVARFAEKLGDYDVSPYMVRSIHDWMYPLIARLIRDANRDPLCQVSDNLWVELKSAGIFDAYRSELSEGEARLLAGVAVIRTDPDALDRWERFDQRFPNLDVAPAFKQACQRLLDKSGELTDGEAQAMLSATGARFREQTTTLGELLNLPPDEMSKVDFCVRAVTDFDAIVADDSKLFYRMLIVKSLLFRFDEFDLRGEHPSDWMKSVQAKLLQNEGLIAQHVTSEAAFWGLVFLALELSAFRDREETVHFRPRQTAHADTHDAIKDYYERHNLTHHVDADGTPWLGDAVEEHVDPDSFVSEQQHIIDAPLATDPDRDMDDETISDAEFVEVSEETPSDATPHRSELSFDKPAAPIGRPAHNNRYEEYE